ncbi:MAG TPA: DUF2090 domain-containing protein, partial [Acidimicrobiales bacterium]|nr:DUF2090 domain-containing protein [Acidimicrobiales bacterium]
LEQLADECGMARSRLPRMKGLLADAFLAVASARRDCGVLVDEEYGAAALERLSDGRFWVARAMDVSGSRPVRLLAGDEAQAQLHGWPPEQTVKVMCYSHPLDDPEMMAAQVAELLRLSLACRGAGRELLVELQAPSGRAYAGKDLAELVALLYRAGLRPEWWKLPAVPDAELWRQVDSVVNGEDPSCRGVLVLGSTASRAELSRAFAVLSNVSCVRGFAVGRAIFAAPVRSWMTGTLDDGQLVAAVALAYTETIAAWNEAGSAKPDTAR